MKLPLPFPLAALPGQQAPLEIDLRTEHMVIGPNGHLNRAVKLRSFHRDIRAVVTQAPGEGRLVPDIACLQIEAGGSKASVAGPDRMSVDLEQLRTLGPQKDPLIHMKAAGQR